MGGLCGKNVTRLGHAHEDVVNAEKLFLVIFSKNNHPIVLIFCIVIKTNGLINFAQAVYAGNI